MVGGSLDRTNWKTFLFLFGVQRLAAFSEAFGFAGRPRIPEREKRYETGGKLRWIRRESDIERDREAAARSSRWNFRKSVDRRRTRPGLDTLTPLLERAVHWVITVNARGLTFQKYSGYIYLASKR